MNKLQQQDYSLVETRQQQQQQQQQQIVTKPVEIMKIEQAKTDNAVTRILNQIIKDILDKMIDKIENNEKT